MLIYLPYGTDAPLYHRPMVIIAMIAINVVVFMMFPEQEQIEPYMLALGDGLHPIQWLTTNFLHADIFHLIFNMLFLWVFGPVVEGRVGLFKTLVIYLGIGILYGASIQILALILGVESGYCLGASAIIYGLAAMSFVWAPESRVHALFIWFILLRGGIKELETEIMIVVGFFAFLQVVSELVFGNPSGLLHGTGAVLGLIVAVTMLWKNLVDCEYEDIFSVYSGKKDRVDREASKPDVVQRRKKREEKRKKRQNLLSEEIELALQNQTPLPAFIIAQRKEKEFPSWTLPQEWHFKMIRQLLAGKHWTEATASMQQYLERHQEQAFFVRLMLAQALLSQNKPKFAAKVLDDISLHESGAEQQSAILKIRAKADAMHQKNLDEGVFELDK